MPENTENGKTGIQMEITSQIKTGEETAACPRTETAREERINRILYRVIASGDKELPEKIADFLQKRKLPL